MAGLFTLHCILGAVLGSASVLGNALEDQLANRAKTMAAMGVGMSRYQIMQKAVTIAKENKLRIPASWQRNGLYALFKPMSRLFIYSLENLFLSVVLYRGVTF